MKILFNIYKTALTLACACLLGASALHAQNTDDLLRYSLLNPSGSPRFMAMGGAFGALGGNASAIAFNPAAMGLYSREEISLSGSITSGNGKAAYYGETHFDNETKVNLPEASAIWLLYNKEENKGLKRLQMGVSVNRLNDYTGAYLVSGFNPESSYMEYVAAQNYGAVVPDLEHEYNTMTPQGRMAYNAYLLDVDNATGYVSTFLEGGNLTQYKRWYTNGNISEMAIALSGNVADKVYIGMNFAVPFVHYYYRSTLGESAPADARLPYNFQNYEYGERFSVSGAGFTFKLGVIYQALPYLRVGAWFHTPTYYALNEDYTMNFMAKLAIPTDENGSPLGSTSDEIRSEYKYNIHTPIRAGAALGFIIGQYGVVDVEGEIVNYNGMRFKIKDDWQYEQELNQQAKDIYQTGGVLRIGTEWRAGIGRFRAGYVFNSSPYRDKDISRNWANHTFSAGVGVAFGRWAIDFGVAYYLQKEDYYLYNIVDETYTPLVQPASLTGNKLVYNLGFSVKF